VTLKQGGTQTQGQLAGLNASQQIAYSTYLRDQAKVGADISMSNKYDAQLRLYASDKGGYGTSAADAVAAINAAIAPLGMHRAGPSAIDQASAQKYLDAATSYAAQANAEWNYTTGAVTAAKNSVPLAAAAKTVDGLRQQIASLQRQIASINNRDSYQQRLLARQKHDPQQQIAALQKQLSAASGSLKAASATAASANIMLNLTSSYVGQLQAGSNPAVLAARGSGQAGPGRVRPVAQGQSASRDARQQA